MYQHEVSLDDKDNLQQSNIWNKFNSGTWISVQTLPRLRFGKLRQVVGFTTLSAVNFCGWLKIRAGKTARATITCNE